MLELHISSCTVVQNIGLTVDSELFGCSEIGRESVSIIDLYLTYGRIS